MCTRSARNGAGRVRRRAELRCLYEAMPQPPVSYFSLPLHPELAIWTKICEILVSKLACFDLRDNCCSEACIRHVYLANSGRSLVEYDDRSKFRRVQAIMVCYKALKLA